MKNNAIKPIIDIDKLDILVDIASAMRPAPVRGAACSGENYRLVTDKIVSRLGISTKRKRNCYLSSQVLLTDTGGVLDHYKVYMKNRVKIVFCNPYTAWDVSLEERLKGVPDGYEVIYVGNSLYSPDALQEVKDD